MGLFFLLSAKEQADFRPNYMDQQNDQGMQADPNAAPATDDTQGQQAPGGEAAA